jgi:hypothetical protein
MLADIAAGHSAASDVLFLVAAIVFAVVFVVQVAVARRDSTALAVALTPAGLCLLAVAWLIL